MNTSDINEEKAKKKATKDIEKEKQEKAEKKGGDGKTDCIFDEFGSNSAGSKSD